MKLLHIFGSPRKNGNTADIARAFCGRAEQHGAAVSWYNLNWLQYRGCQACFACKQGEESCILKDDIAPALEAMLDADVILFSSPVYYSDVSAQLKGFIDRTFCHLVSEYWKHEHKTRLKPGKQLVFLLAQGVVDETRFSDIFNRYQEIFSWHEFEEIHQLRAVGVYWPGQAVKQLEIIQEAEQLADRIFSSGAGPR